MSISHKRHTISRRTFLKTAGWGAASLVIGHTVTPGLAATSERWAASTNLNITIHSATEPAQILTNSFNDFKPSWSPDGSMLTFFRAKKYGEEL